MTSWLAMSLFETACFLASGYAELGREIHVSWMWFQALCKLKPTLLSWLQLGHVSKGGFYLFCCFCFFPLELEQLYFKLKAELQEN